MEKSIVSIVKGKAVNKMLRKAIDLIGGIESFVKPGDIVLVKPNAHGAHPPESHVDTNPKVVAAVVRLCKAAGAKEVIIGEASGIGQDSIKSLEVSGIKKAAEEAGADRFIDLEKDEYIRVEIPKGKLIKYIDLPKTVLTSDVLINVPVLKTHHGTVITCALKNIKGIIRNLDKKKSHRIGVEWVVPDIHLAKKPNLVVVDAIVAMEGMGPLGGKWTMEAPNGEKVTLEMVGGEPVEMDLIIASADPVAADTTCAKIMGIDPEKIPMIRNAYAHGIGKIKPNEMEIKGNKIEEVARKFKLPPEDLTRYYKYVSIHDEGACSGCRAYLVWALENLRARGLLEQRKEKTIVIGADHPAILPIEWGRGENLVLIGNCTGKWKGEGAFVPGCPPVGRYFMQAIMESKVDEVVPEGETPWIIRFYQKYPRPLPAYLRQV